MFFLIFLLKIFSSKDFRKNIINLNKARVYKAFKWNRWAHKKYFKVVDIQLENIKRIIRKFTYKEGERKILFNEFEIFKREISELELDFYHFTESILLDEIIYKSKDLYRKMENEEYDYISLIENYKESFLIPTNKFFDFLDDVHTVNDNKLNRSYKYLMQSIDNYITFIEKYFVYFTRLIAKRK